MKSSEYWQKRSEQIAKDQYDKADQYLSKLGSEYGRAMQEIQRNIEVFYQRYATNDEISLADTRKILQGKELNEFKMTLEEFTRKAKNNADGRWTKELNNVYYRTRISRFEALKVQVRQQVELLAGSRQKGARELLGDIYEDTYYRTMFELQKGTGIGVNFARLDQEGMDKVLSTEFAESNWSKRIWGDRNKLTRELQTKLSQSFIRGDSVDRTIKDVSARFNVSRSNAERLIETETSFFTGQATLSSYKESGIVKKYEVLATLDNRTTEICQQMDGKVFPNNQAEVNINYPPFHVRCRTTVMPYFDDDFDEGERIARDEDGSTYYVPNDIKYPDWKKKYV
ncbi:minor capsid protein [Chengkuizengella sp. SCS-71B]|uniref:minor capsid protein n=1 Tax=Chengkuizengella sp. SCS-71B TaxID=3115290 RepID=UPI0032C2344D